MVMAWSGLAQRRRHVSFHRRSVLLIGIAFTAATYTVGQRCGLFGSKGASATSGSKAGPAMNALEIKAKGGSLPRFSVIYDIVAKDKDAAQKLASDVCIEQTVEVPPTLVEGTWIGDEVVGHIEELVQSPRTDADAWRVRISYPDAAVGTEFSQLMNIIYGLSSVGAGIQLVDIQLSEGLAKAFPGPRFGVEGLREILNVPPGKPILSTALKPLGKSTEELAALAYEFARSGGVDIIKDDDGLSDQEFAPFEERVVAISAAVKRAVEETGKVVLYAPCLNAPAEKILGRAKFAVEHGAGAVLMLPGITGFDSMKALADDPTFGLPILCHPSLLGFLGGSSAPGWPVNGFSHGALFGLLPRLAGADVSIFLNIGGRFPTTAEESADIVDACRRTLGDCKQMLPSPAGGMPLVQDKVDEMLDVYGGDQMFLVGGALYIGGTRNITENTRQYAILSGRGDQLP